MTTPSSKLGGKCIQQRIFAEDRGSTLTICPLILTDLAPGLRSMSSELQNSKTRSVSVTGRGSSTGTRRTRADGRAETRSDVFRILRSTPATMMEHLDREHGRRKLPTPLIAGII